MGRSEISGLIGIDGENAIVTIGATNYYLSYDHGILTLVPVNHLHMALVDSTRHYIFAQDSVYTIQDRMTVNSGSSYVIGTPSVPAYSIDMLKVKDKEGKISWFGLKMTLVDHSGSDYYYESESGEITFSDGFVPAVGASGSVSVCGQTYNFTMTEAKVGKVDKEVEHDYMYGGTYTGKVDGKDAVLTVSNYDAFSLTVDGKTVFDFSISDIRSMVNGGIDYANDSALLYDDNNNIAYNIKLDTVNSTFSVIAGDGYAGKYLLTTDSTDYDGSYLFLDGFGHGIFKGKGTDYGSRAYLSYTIENGMVKTEFIDTRPIYAYGSYAHFFIDTFHNALVLGYSDIDGLIGLRYETMTVTKGLKVDVSNYIINMTENKQDAVDALLSYFTIVTADGVVSDADKASYIDYSCVDFDHKGFYLVTVKATIDGVDYFKYFTFEVVEPVYEGNPVVGDYTSVYSSSYKLTVNKFGTAEFIYSSTVYKGLVTIADDNSFSFTGTSSSNATVTVTGQLEMNGVVSVTVKGDRSHTNYFVNSDVKTSETGLKRNPVIRTFKNGDEIGYFMCSSETSLGEKVEITSLNGIEAMTAGSVIQLTVSGSEPKIYKVVSSNTWSGLQEPDANRGTYTSTGSESLVLDGFGVSNNEKGLATIGTEKYDYYMFSTSLIALYAPGTTSVFGYATIDGQTYEMLPLAFENSGMVGTFGVVSYSSVSASTHKFAIDAYGVGTYTNSSTAYTGRLIANDDGTYTFVGINKSSSTAKTVTIEIAKIQDLVFSMNITGSVSASNIFMVGYKSTSVQYLGENYSNYITTVTLADDSQVSFFYTSSSAIPQVVTVSALNEIPYGTAGSIFSVTALDGTKIIDYAKFVKVATSGGYIKADEKRGTYKATGQDEIVLDGFATVSGGVGEAKVGDAIGTYTIFSGNVLTVNVGDVSYKVTVDPVNGTYAKLEETYSGIFLGTFKEMTTNSSFYGYGMTFDKYGLGVLQTSSSSLYNGTVVFNADGRGFTFSGQSGTSKMDISGKLITDDILAVTYGSKITFYVRDTVTASLYAAETSNKNIIYRVTIGGTDHYLFAPTNTTIVDQEVTLEKCADSPVELGVKDAVFAIKYGETEIVAKYVKAGTNGIVLANMAERKTYTATDGTVLFTDGFTTSQTSRGKATLGTAEYTYFYNPALPNTIMLYGNDGAIAQYATYADDASYVLAEKILEGSRMIEGTYVSMASSYSKFTVDQFGYAVYNSDYYGRFVYNESKGVYEITFVYKSNASRTIYGEAKMLNDGVMLFDYSTKSNYDTGCAYFTVGTSVMTGKSWTNFVYSATVNGVTTYYFAPDRGNDVSTYIGEVTVEIADPELPFGTKGCIFTVKSRTDGSVILKARFLTANGNSGYELSDGMDGTYTCTDHEDIVLDGFGSAVMGAKTGTYTASGTTVTITIDGMKYTGDSAAKTYVEAGAMSEDVLANKTFTANYDVYSEGWDGYAGTTTFVFDGLGNVKITSVCTDGYGAYDYSPTFTGDGTYVLTGDTVVVTAKNGATFTFTLNATDNPTSLKCTATSLSSSAHGYCKNETFSLKA